MQKDFLLDSNSLQIFSGDFVLGNCDNQNVALIVQYHAGWLKSDPTLGIGIDNMLLGQVTPQMRKLISEQLTADGYKLKTLSFDTSGNLIVEI